MKVRTASTRASWVAKARGGGLGVPSSHGGQPVPPGSIEVVRRGRMRWLGAHLELLSCSLTAAHHAQLYQSNPPRTWEQWYCMSTLTCLP